MDGKWIEEYIKLKKHLDLLEKPYAIGICPDRNRKLIVRMAQADQNEFLQRLLCENVSFHLEAKAATVEDYQGYEDLLKVEDEDGKVSLSWQSEQEELLEWEAAVLQSGDPAIYLVVNDWRVAEADIDAAEGTIAFTEKLIGDGGSFEESDFPLLKLLEDRSLDWRRTISAPSTASHTGGCVPSMGQRSIRWNRRCEKSRWSGSRKFYKNNLRRRNNSRDFG